MAEITCSTPAGAILHVAFAATAFANYHAGTIKILAEGQPETYCHTTSAADSAESALDLITARDIREGEREVREGHWISLAELRRELRDQDR